MNIPLDRVGLLPDGIYLCRVTETEDRTSQAGNPYVNLTCEVLDDMGRPTEAILWHTLTMTPKARFMVSKFLDAIGAPKTEGGSLNSRSLKGKRFWAEIGKDTYQGKSKNVIKNPLTPEEAKKDEDTINNVFSTTYEPDPEPTGEFDPNDVGTWEEDEDGPGSLPDEMSEDDVKF